MKKGFFLPPKPYNIILGGGIHITYLLLFCEGILTFISPCLLPMLPVYFTFLAGQEGDKLMRNATLFVTGFTLVFTAMGAASGSLGSFLVRYRRPLEIGCGLIIIFLGLTYSGLLNIGFMNREWRPMLGRASGASPLLFGAAFGLGWTPCIGPMLASALMAAAATASALGGMLMLLCYALGIATPFLITAYLFEQLKVALDFLKRRSEGIKRVSGVFMVLCGILMMTGYLTRFLAF